MEIDGIARQVRFQSPKTPDSLEWIDIKGLRVTDTSVDLRLRRAGSDVAVEVLDKHGSASVVVTKEV